MGVRLALGCNPEECGKGNKLSDYIRHNKPNGEEAKVIVSIHIQNKCRTLIKLLDVYIMIIII